jgi:hypothetical protein
LSLSKKAIPLSVEEKEEKQFDQYDLIEKVMKDADREEKESLKVCTVKLTHVVTSIKSNLPCSHLYNRGDYMVGLT